MAASSYGRRLRLPAVVTSDMKQHHSLMKQSVPSVDASIRLLSLIATGDGGGPIQAVARRLAITNSSCFRILRTLKDAGWVSEKTSSERTIGPTLLELVRVDDVEGRLITATREPIRSLALATGLACKLSARRGTQAVTLDRAEPASPISITSPAGSTFTLCLGASGAVLASQLSADELDQAIVSEKSSATWRHQSVASFRARVAHARRNGWAMDRGSYHPNIHSISRAIRSGSNGLLGAVTLLGMSGDFQPGRVRKLQPLLRRCVEDVEAAMGGDVITKAGGRV